MSLEQLLTVILDAVVSIVVEVIVLLVAPEYQPLAHTIVAAFQGIAAALIVYFAAERQIRALRVEIERIARGR